MSLLRLCIYLWGGLVLTVLWVCSSFTSLPANTQRDLSGWEMVLVPLLGWLLLVVIDRWIHSSLFGTRNVVRLRDYRPCPICPVTGRPGDLARKLVFRVHLAGIIDAAVEYRLPILISRDCETKYPRPDIEKIPGFTIARFTNTKAIVYIKSRSYQDHFATANQAALE